MEKHFNFKYRNTIITFREDWSNVLMPYNYKWVEFTWIKFYSELDKVFGNFELEFALLGLHFEFRITYNKKQNAKEVKRLLNKFKRSKKWVQL
jgi:hypothetical protein